MFKSDHNITDGVNSSVWAAMQKTIIADNKPGFFSLYSFAIEIIVLAIENKSLEVFNEYIYFPASIYSAWFSKSRLPNKNLNLSDTYLGYGANELVGILNRLASNDSESNEVKKTGDGIDKFYYSSFNSFSRMLYLAFTNRDFNSFHYLLNRYGQIEDSYRDKSYSLKYEISKIRIANSMSNNDNILGLERQYNALTYFDKYKRHVLSGVKFWGLYLYDLNKISEDEVKNSVFDIVIPYEDNKDAILDIMLFRGRINHFYFEWGGWDYEEHIDGVVYSPHSPHQWMTLGFIADLISNGRVYFNSADLSAKELENIEFLRDDVIAYTEKFIKEYDKWKSILNVGSVDDLKEKCESIINFFTSAKRKRVGEVEQSIADAKISRALVNEFRDSAGLAWANTAKTRNVFKAMNNVLVNSAHDKLKQIGERVFFEKAKMMFIDNDHYRPIYGASSIGGQVGMWEEEIFFNHIIQESINLLSGLSVLDIIDKAIAELAKTKIIPDVIFISPSVSYRDESLADSSRFVEKNKIETYVKEDNLNFVGKLDDISIYYSLCEPLKNKVVVCNFKQAFLMKYKTNANWYKNELKVDVSEVSIEHASKKLQENPSKWKTGEDFILNDDDALTLIRTSVIIDIWSVADFDILSKDAYAVGYIRG